MSNLHILTPNEQQLFDYPPMLSAEMRGICFAINPKLEKEINRLRGSTNKVGFFLQYGYFKACKRFFLIHRYRQEDIEYTAKLLGIKFQEVDLSVYKKKAPLAHQKKILALVRYKPFNDEADVWVKSEAIARVKIQTEPRQIFFHLTYLLEYHQIELPSYHRLADSITQAYSEFEQGLLLRLHKKLTVQDKAFLDKLIDDDNAKSQTLLNQLKTINQSYKPKAIQASLTLFKTVKDYFLNLNSLIISLNLSPSSSAYYATWVQKAKLSQLKQFSDKNKLYLHLLAFIQHQFYARQDYFVDVILKCVQSTKNTVIKTLNTTDQLTRTERRKAVRQLTQSNRHYRVLIDEIADIVKSPVGSDASKILKINALLDEDAEQQQEAEQRIELLEKLLDRIANNQDYFDILEKLSVKLQRRIAEIVKTLIFNSESSDEVLIQAIDHFRDHESHLNQHVPAKFLEKEEQTAILDEKQKLRISLYKTLLFIHIADAMKSGKLNLHYSYRYKAIHEYLVDATTWVSQRDKLLKLAGLEAFSNYQTTMEDLRLRLEEKYQQVNESFIGGRNPYLSIDKDGLLHITTPALEDKDTEYIAKLLEHVGYVPIFQVLSDIEKPVQLLECFKHHSVKHVKQRPTVETYFAGIISLGCNIGVRKMAQISMGIKENTLVNSVNWYFSLVNLQTANQRIIELIHKLSLPQAFLNDKEALHSSSDGRKVNVDVDSLIASRSYKYFGKDKGVNVYTFIDERQTLFHSLVMSATEREAPYAIDGLLKNDVVKTSIHSTDTHGFTETVFAATHLLNIAFAPRIKNIGKQRIYAFSARKTYEKRGYKVLPSRAINQRLIEKHWEDILRFMVTIKLKLVTASQLFKRLSSYAKDNPLYQALKELGRIVKSVFILTYFDDVKLRQRIERQLNRIELSNKFSNAVFFANNREFKQATREEQEVATACKILIQNAIILWNYLYLSQLLANCFDKREREDMVNFIKEGSVITWRHVNLHGEYDFRQSAANDYRFDMRKILSFQLA